ncbi:hypothetical protein TrRE_jg8813 [Triparma retinervis]|uniref:Uncharacterized protein n=1 Tax=Triparma retinervis TaxID=2557542 RepID=A0A9W7FIF9_9STRA|nr:hypothetical protein TrRE_jg8813 [Triparma retinervis]
MTVKTINANPVPMEMSPASTDETSEAYSLQNCIDALKAKDATSWGWTAARSCSLAFFLYFFLFFLDVMGGSFKVLGGCEAGAMFKGLDNPIAGLMTGIIATVLVQSSSTSTSIVVSLVGSDAMTVRVAIPVIMGANIGTSVTNTIVSFGQVNDDDQFERAFAGATVHDMFNYLTVITLLPIELATKMLESMTDAMKPKDVSDDEKWVGPIKKWVGPLVKRLINANKDVIKDVAKGTYTCDELYAYVHDGDETNPDVVGKKGLIKCSNIYNPFTGEDSAEKICPEFYKEHASKSDDMASGGVCLFISIMGLCVCLYALVKTLQSMVMASSTALIKKATNINPYLAIVIGVGVTLLVQSSSITTSVLTPLVGMDIIKLEAMLPLTLGANIGTTGTALLASMVSDKPESVQIALCHLFFNIFGILIWFPIPFMRQYPLRAARQLGWLTRQYKLFPAVYILFMFVIFPGIFLGISQLFTTGGAYNVIGVFLLIVIALGVVRVIFFFIKQDGWTKVAEMLTSWQESSDFKKNLKSKIESLEEKVNLLENGGAVAVKTGSKI